MGASRRQRRKIERAMMKDAARSYRAIVRQERAATALAELEGGFSEVEPEVVDEPAPEVVEAPQPSSRELARRAFRGE